MSATIPQKRQHPLQHRARVAKKPRAESTSEEDNSTQKPPKIPRTARKSRMVESSESSETERDSDDDEVLDFMRQDRCLVPLKGRVKGRASTLSDSKTVSTTVIPPSPFLGAPFTFALSTPYVPATPAEATVHTPSVVESDPTPANAPLVESAPTPPDAPLVESDPTPADAPLVEPSPTPADVPLVELAPTPPDAPPADALATPARTVASTEPVPRLLSFQELSESAKGGQTCGTHRQLNDAASRTSARPSSLPKSKDIRSALSRRSRTNKSDLKDYGFTSRRPPLWPWGSKPVLKSGFTPDKPLPPRTAGTLLSSDDHRQPSSSATVDQGQLLPPEISRYLQNQNDPSQIDPSRCSPPLQMCASSSCVTSSRTSTPMDQDIIIPVYHDQRSTPMDQDIIIPVYHDQRSSPPGPTGSTPMDQELPPRLRSQDDKQCWRSPTPLMSMSACAHPPSQINESPVRHVDVSLDSMDASSACVTGPSSMDQNVPSIGGFFAATMLEGVNKVYTMVDQSIKTQELAATRLTTKIDQLTSGLAILQEEVRMTKEDTIQQKPLSRLRNSKHSKRKVFEDFDADDEGGDGDEDDDERGNYRRTAAWTRLQGAIRMHMISLLRIKNLSPNQLRRLPPPLTDEEVERFDNDDDGAVLCTPKNFRIDFSRSWKTFQFNQASRDVFVAHFLKCVEDRFYETFDLLPEYLTKEKVGIALDAHVDYIRRGYKKLDKSPTRPRDAELKAQAQNSRKDTLFDSRVRACMLRPALRRHLALLHRLTRSAMSGDETDAMGPPKVFRIIEQEWQSKEFRTFMRTLDSIYRAEWANPHGRRRVPGNAPRIRVVRGKTEAGHAPRGLPRNCYDQEWYDSLRPFQQRRLERLEEDFDFGIHADEL